jgi:hypothetical protein
VLFTTVEIGTLTLEGMKRIPDNAEKVLYLAGKGDILLCQINPQSLLTATAILSYSFQVPCHLTVGLL